MNHKEKEILNKVSSSYCKEIFKAFVEYFHG